MLFPGIEDSSVDPSRLLKDALARGGIEDTLDQFDQAWHEGHPPRIEDALPSDGSAGPHEVFALGVELIKIDLEHRWRRSRGLTEATRPGELPWRACLEDYQALLHQRLGQAVVPLELITEEYRVRHLWGDRPQLDGYFERFPAHDRVLLDRHLQAVDRELQRRTSLRQGRCSSAPSVDEHGFSPALATLEVGDEIDDFRLLNELGQGAFARVFLAQQKSMQRLVALKVTERRSFESPVLSKLDHPHIVRVFDERAAGTLTLMYMQYVPGGTLRRIVDWRQRTAHGQLDGRGYLEQLQNVLKEKGETPTALGQSHAIPLASWSRTVAWLGARLAGALDHAHRAGVWHRDIKPENILISADGRPMLVDFNLSFGQAVVGSSIEDAFGGSLAYMSPEQLRVLLGLARVDAVGSQSDVYSLAIVLWELLAGVRPFAEESTPGQVPAADSGENWSLSGLLASRQRLPDVSQLPADCPQGLVANLLQALESDPHHRPSARALARQLQLCIDPALDRLLHPPVGSWTERWSRQPLRWLIALGLLPNACVSLLNIWANGRLTTHNFDRAFFDNVEKPAVNMLAYTVGIVAALLILGPIARNLQSGRRLSEDQRHRMARRSLTAPAQASLVILALWSVSGLIFPLWNRVSQHSHVGVIDVSAFVVSQVLHGIIAATTTFALASLVTTRAFLPRFLPDGEDAAGQRELDKHLERLSRAGGALALTPLIAVLALAFSDQFDKSVFVALAMVGFAGHMLTSLVTPQIRASVVALRKTFLSTHELLQ